MKSRKKNMITFVKNKDENMNKTFNIYCDESCHIENDHKKYIFLGSISSAYPQVKRHTERISHLKKKHNFYAEIKWSHVSMSKIQFYLDLIDYFFDTDLRYEAIGVEKSKIQCDDYDDNYYEMYYRLLTRKKDTLYTYNVYLDIKDTLSAFKVQRLKEILNVKYGVFRNVQTMSSKESTLLQLADFITGALSYEANDDLKHNQAKVQIIEKIKKHCNSLIPEPNTTSNIFFIDLE